MRQKLKNIVALAYDSLHAEMRARLLVDRANASEFGVRFRALTYHAPTRALCREKDVQHTPPTLNSLAPPKTRAHRHRPASKPPIALLADQLEGKLKKVTVRDGRCSHVEIRSTATEPLLICVLKNGPNTSEVSLSTELSLWRWAWPRKFTNRSKILPICLEEDFPQRLQNNAGWSLSRRL